MNRPESVWYLYLAMEKDHGRFSIGCTQAILEKTARLNRTLPLDRIMSVHYEGAQHHLVHLLDELYVRFSDYALTDSQHPDDDGRVYRGQAVMQVRQFITANAQSRQIRLRGRLPFDADLQSRIGAAAL